jgi:hypothetical protein
MSAIIYGDKYKTGRMKTQMTCEENDDDEDVLVLCGRPCQNKPQHMFESGFPDASGREEG